MILQYLPESGPRVRPSVLRVRMLVFSVIYVGCIFLAYTQYLSPFQGDLSYPAFAPGRSGFALTIAIASAVVFAVSMPPQIKTYAHFVIWFLYFFLFTPTVMVVALQGFEADGGTKLILHIVASFGLVVFTQLAIAAPQSICSYDYQAKFVEASGARLYALLLIGYALVMTVLFVMFGSIMNIASFYEVYEQRDIAAQVTGNRTIVAYLIEWTARVLAPFMLTIGLISKRKIYVVLAIAAFVTLYAIGGTKFIPALIVLIIVLHGFVFRSDEILAERLALIAICGVALPLFLGYFYGFLIDSALDMFIAQTLHRVFGTPGSMIGHYSIVFDSNPLTYYSHVGAFRWLLDYPYGEYSVGQVVGDFLVNKTSYEANANFWAIDGIAALHHVGILVIGAVLAVVIAVFSRITRPLTLRVMCLSSVASVWMLVDGSLFRVLLSGGWFLHPIIVYIFFSWRSRAS